MRREEGGGGGGRSPFVHVVLLSLSLPQLARSLAVAEEVVGGRLPPGAAMLPLFGCKQPPHQLKSNQTVFISHFKCQKQNVPQSARQKNKNMKQKCNPAGRRLCVAPWSLTGVPGVCRGRIRGTGAGARSHRAGGKTGLRQQHTQEDITSCTWPRTAAVARGRHAHSRSLSVLAQSEAGEACL